MIPSLYTGVISQDTYNSLVASIVSKYTNENAAMPLLHKQFLTPEYSVNGTFVSISEAIENFMVDVVATDSKLPLKNREKVALLQGYIPKIGNKMFFNEQQLQDLDAMVAQTSMPIEELLVKLFADADTLIKGALLRNEYIFLQGLSKGKASITDTDNVGVEFECDYDFLPANKSYASVAWGGPTANEYGDFEASITKALNSGVIVTNAFMNPKTFGQLMASAQKKFANAIFTKKSFEDFVSNEFGVKIYVVNRVVTAQINGVNKNINAWEDGQITFTADDKLGKLFWTRTAEFNHKVGGVLYSDADNGVFLVSKYSKNDPVAEFTSIQGRCLPVIRNVQNIFQLDTTKTSA